MTYSWVVTNAPSKLHSNGILAIFPKNKPFFAEILKAKLEFLEARLRPVEHLDKEVEIECRSSRTCD
jgi:hypothetical protein